MFEEHAPPIRVMAISALAYCERLFYLEEVEGLHVADDLIYAGRELHESLGVSGRIIHEDRAESGEPVSLDLSCPLLGLVGRLDAVRFYDGRYVPYEHKRGQAKRDASDEPVAWPDDALQIGAYALMLEEAYGVTVTEGRIRYHRDGVTVRVVVDEGLRRAVRAAIQRARELRDRLERPPVTSHENRCRRCSLAPVCLPEESRLAAHNEHIPKRLFPGKDARTAVHVLSQGARVGRDGECLVITTSNGVIRRPSGEVGAVILHGMSQISTQALRLCADRDIAVHWVTQTGGHVASLTNTVGQVQRRIRQYQALYGPEGDALRLRLAKAVVISRLDGQRRYILRVTRERPAVRTRTESALHALARGLRKAGAAQDVDELRGHEGAATRAYWSVFNDLLVESVPPELRFVGRTRRPATDRLSALMNFGYGLLRTAVMRGILAVGLEPALGFYHTPRSAAHPLVLDLMEPFRLLLWDIPVIGALNRSMFDSTADFVSTKGAVWLSDQGRRKAIGLFEKRLQETWKHPVVGYSLSYERTIELEARLLEKEWSGEPGLFSQLRIR